MHSSQKNFFLSLGIHLILFIGLWIFLCPVYQSRDDVFLLYLLSGGFGNAPTELLHYNHILHPLLGCVLKSLFIAWPKINWYSVSLVTTLFVSGSILFFVLLQQQKRIIAFVLYILFFFVFLSWAFLHMNLSLASSFGAIASAVLFLYYSKNNKRWVFYLAPLVLLIWASLFRIHAIIPLVLVFAPLFFFIDKTKSRLRFVAAFLFACACIFLLNRQHVAYYKKHIPGWEKEEAYRQEVFAFVNKEIDYNKETLKSFPAKIQILWYGFFFDTAFFDIESIHNFNKQTHQLNKKSFQEIRVLLYWLFTDNRIFFGFLFFVFLLAFLIAEKKYRIWIVCSLLISVMLVVYLKVFLKLPYFLLPVIFAGAVSGFFVMLPRISFNQRLFYISGLTAILLTAYSFVRIYKMNNSNIKYEKIFELAITEIANKREHFFVVMHPDFPIEYFPVKKVTSEFSLSNVVFRSHFLNNEASAVFERNGIMGLQDLWKNEKVLIWSLPSTDNPSAFDFYLQKYFGEKYKTVVRFSEPLPGYQFGEVRRLRFPDTP